MELAEKAEVADEVGPRRAEGGAEVVKGQAGDPADEEVRRARRPPARHSLGPPVPPAAHHVEALLELREEARDLLREVLKIGVEGHQDLSTGGVETGLQGGGLPVVAGEFENAEPWLRLHALLHCVQRTVVAAVVDEHDLEVVAVRYGSHRGGDAPDEFRYDSLLVVDRGDHAHQRLHGRGPSPVRRDHERR